MLYIYTQRLAIVIYKKELLLLKRNKYISSVLLYQIAR